VNDEPSSPGARSALRRFLRAEAAGGLILVAASVLALVAANSVWGEAYRHLLHFETGPSLSPRLGPMTVHLWINDGLMALFFLLVGLEIKREFVAGGLATWEQRRLPLIAAAAGMVLPAILYLALAGATPGLARGWAIPAATDIAFALAVLALLGPRVPIALKLLLTTIAIADDLGAVAIIALAYSDSLDLAALGAAVAVLAAMSIMGRSGVARLWPYLLAALLLWYFVLLSGVHATVAGVLAAAFMPVGVVSRLEHRLTPWVAFAIVPLFGFANAGVFLAGFDPASLLAPLPLGIAFGLFLGKQLGIYGAIRLSVRFGLAPRPEDASWLQIYAMATLCGIGFTMSLFIGALAFPGDPALVEQAKIGTLIGSLVSALAGYALLRLAPAPGARGGRDPSD
jgi:NhaA family Na+:H+ antiporter